MIRIGLGLGRVGKYICCVSFMDLRKIEAGVFVWEFCFGDFISVGCVG